MRLPLGTRAKDRIFVNERMLFIVVAVLVGLAALIFIINAL